MKDPFPSIYSANLFFPQEPRRKKNNIHINPAPSLNIFYIFDPKPKESGWKWGYPNHGPVLIIHFERDLLKHTILLGPRLASIQKGPKTTTQLVNKCFIAYHDTYHVTLLVMLDWNPAASLYDTPAGDPIHVQTISRWSDKAGNWSWNRATYRYKAHEMSANTWVRSESPHHP